jgi:glutamate synthase domain-containing protein 2
MSRLIEADMTYVWIVLGAVILLAVWDICQKKHAILRNFPILGHFRYLLESIGPELRQYIVTDNDSERPFNRDQRRWVYAVSKNESPYFGFGTDNDLENAQDYLIIKHNAFPVQSARPNEPDYDPTFPVPCAKILGGWRQRRNAFRPRSVVNVSAMSFGSLSAAAVEALNRGCEMADCLHNTGEGAVSPHHLKGGNLIWQIGTGYFGCRNDDGSFNIDRLLETCERTPAIKALEIKLSQGAKAGLGGMVLAAKVTPEIAAIRGIPAYRNCFSPTAHSAFKDADSLLDWVEMLADKTGLPVGIKSAVGELDFWEQLAGQIENTDRAVDFITIDGGEGGSGAAPRAYADHVSLPFRHGFSRVYRLFAEHGLHHKIVFNGAGKLGFPETALFAFGVGADLISVAREAMLSIGCIQAQRCHTGHCPAGVATQNRWLMRGLDPTSKSTRCANYLTKLRQEILQLSHTCGAVHPALVTPDHFEILDGPYDSQSIGHVFKYREGDAIPSGEDIAKITELMANR